MRLRLAATSLAATLLASAAVAESDAARGERVFQRCYACHSVDPAETELPGPNLAGVVGRRAASRGDFDYSPAMREAGRRGLVWDEATLDARSLVLPRFRTGKVVPTLPENALADPVAAIPGAAMSFPGLRNEADRRDAIAYLKAARP